MLETYDPTAYGFMLQQADAAGGIPWHVMEVPEQPIDVRNFSNWWDDNRCGVAPPQCSPIDYASAQNNADHGLLIVPSQNGYPPVYGVQLSPPHAPGTGLVAYLMIGSRHYLDEVIADAGKAMTDTWAYGVRNWYGGTTLNPANDAIIGENWELRAGAWDMRSLLTGLLVTPDAGSGVKDYFATIMNDNLAFIAADATANEYGRKSALAGWIDGYSASGNLFAPWQSDYLALTLEWAEQASVPTSPRRRPGWTPT